MCSNYEFHNWGLGCELTTCHIHLEKKIDMTKHTHERSDYIDIVVFSGKKWEVLHIKL